jgi:hypothetical protein
VTHRFQVHLTGNSTAIAKDLEAKEFDRSLRDWKR